MEDPELLPATATATLRHLRAQMVAGSDIHDKLHALTGFVTQLLDRELGHPARTQRDAEDAVAADPARGTAPVETLTGAAP